MTFTRRGVVAFLWLSAGVCLAGSGCGRTGQQPPEESADGGAVEGAGDVEEGAPAEPTGPPGSVAVVITCAGEATGARKIEVDTDREYCGGKVFAEDLIVDKQTGGLKNAVVRLEKVRVRRRPAETFTVTNRNCAFEPHVQVAVKGSKISIENADPILHTTHPYLNGRSLFNVPLQKDAPPYPPRPVRDSGIMKIKCDVHKWMEGWVVVHDNPFVAVSDDKGKLTISDVPPGTYPYVVWHEKLGEQKGTVTVRSGETTRLELEYAR